MSHLAPLAPQGTDQLQAAPVLERQVGEHDFRTDLGQQRQSLAQAAGDRDDFHVRRLGEQIGERIPNKLVVFDHRNANHGGPPRGADIGSWMPQVIAWGTLFNVQESAENSDYIEVRMRPADGRSRGLHLELLSAARCHAGAFGRRHPGDPCDTNLADLCAQVSGEVELVFRFERHGS